MKYTENYHLPQWVREDRIMMEDFNQMCADIEAGLIRSSADGMSAAAQASASAAAAQSTANAALAKANAAYSPSQQPYVVGTYKGNGSVLTVTIGFRPKFLIISRQCVLTMASVTFSSGFAMAGSGLDVAGLALLDDGFKVSANTVEYTDAAPHINSPSGEYAYIAFR